MAEQETPTSGKGRRPRVAPTRGMTDNDEEPGWHRSAQKGEPAHASSTPGEATQRQRHVRSTTSIHASISTMHRQDPHSYLGNCPARGRRCGHWSIPWRRHRRDSRASLSVCPKKEGPKKGERLPSRAERVEQSVEITWWWCRGWMEAPACTTQHGHDRQWSGEADDVLSSLSLGVGSSRWGGSDVSRLAFHPARSSSLSSSLHRSPGGRLQWNMPQ